MLNRNLLALGAGALLALTGCPDNNNNGGDGGTDGGTDGGSGFVQPEGTVALNFTIDATDRAGEYEDEDLQWKGSFTYDAETRKITYSSDWAGGVGPYAPLYDDGPWSSGGHEPAGSTAGDNKFGVTVFIDKPTEELTLNYGAQIAPNRAGCTDANGCWIWVGGNGEIVIPANATGPITAEGLKLAPIGDIDVKVTLNADDLDPDFTLGGPVATVEIKGTFTTWAESTAYDDGTHGDDIADDKIYTYVLSEDEIERALVASGNIEEWVWVINDSEYKVDGAASKVGVSVYTKAPDETEFQDQTENIDSYGEFHNTGIEIP